MQVEWETLEIYPPLHFSSIICGKNEVYPVHWRSATINKLLPCKALDHK